MLNTVVKKLGWLLNISGSTIGERIRVSGRDTFAYINGSRKTTVYAEALTGRIERRICVWSIRKWHPPHDMEEIAQEEKAAILSCLCSYFDKHNIVYELLEDGPLNKSGD